MARHAQQSEALYFQMHGLTAQAPEALNETLRRAIETMRRTLYAPSRDELTPWSLEGNQPPLQACHQHERKPQRPLHGHISRGANT